LLAQAVAAELQAMGVVDDVVEDGVREGRLADQVAAPVNRDLAGGTAVIPDCVTPMVCPISAPRVIVVVEDEVLIRLAVLAALEEANFRVIEAGHAGEALAVLD